MLKKIHDICDVVFNPDLEALFAVQSLITSEKTRARCIEFYGDNKVTLWMKKYRFLYDTTAAIMPLEPNGITEFISDMDVSTLTLETFHDYILSHTPIRFLSIQFNFSASEEATLQAALENNALFDDYYEHYESKCPNFLGFYSFMHETERYINDYFSLAKEMMTKDFFKYIDEKDAEMRAFSDEMKAGVITSSPLDFSQQVMGKTFYNQGPYSSFVFIPSYFVYARAVRYFYPDETISKSNRKQQVLIISLYYRKHQPTTNADMTTSALKVLSDKTRYQILTLLSSGEPVYGLDIVKALSLAPSTVSHHMEQLKKAGLVHEEPVRQAKYYSINSAKVSELITLLKTDLRIE